MKTTDEQRSAFGARLRALREERQMTLVQLSGAVDEAASAQSLSAYEQGKWAPNDMELVALLDDALDAAGELVAIFERPASNLETRVDHLEVEVREIRQLVERVVARPPRRRGPGPR